MSKENPNKNNFIGVHFSLERKPIERENPRTSEVGSTLFKSQGPRVSQMRIIRDDETIYRTFEGDGRYAESTSVTTLGCDIVDFQKTERNPHTGKRTTRIKQEYANDNGQLTFEELEKFDESSGKCYQRNKQCIDKDSGYVYLIETTVYDRISGEINYKSEYHYDRESSKIQTVIHRKYDDVTHKEIMVEKISYNRNGGIAEKETIHKNPTNGRLISKINEKHNASGILRRVELFFDPDTQNASLRIESDFDPNTHQLKEESTTEFFKSKFTKIHKKTTRYFDAESSDGAENLLEEIVVTYNDASDTEASQRITTGYSKDIQNTPDLIIIETYDPITRTLRIVKNIYNPATKHLKDSTTGIYIDEKLSGVTRNEYDEKGNCIRILQEKYKSNIFKWGKIQTFNDGNVTHVSVYTDRSHIQIIGFSFNVIE